jgi:hypothetical protein
VTTRARRVQLPAAEIPPADYDLERGVLGGAVFDAENLAHVRRLLTPEHFHHDGHRVVARHVLTLADSGDPVDLLTLARSLRDADDYDMIGGAPMLAQLTEDGAKVIPAYMPRYCADLDALYRKRTTVQLARTLDEHAGNGHDPAKLLAEARGLVEFLSTGSETASLAPTVERRLDDLVVRFASRAVELVFEGLTLGREGAHADLTASLRGRELAPASRLNLSSTRGRADFAKALAGGVPGLPWSALVDIACTAARRAARYVEPAVELTPVTTTATRYLLDPLLVAGQPTVLFADGGSGKSYLLHFAAQALAHKLPLRGMTPTLRAASLILNWESDQQDAAERATMTAAGLGVPLRDVHHLRMTGALVDHLPQIRREVERLGIAHVGVDSFVPALGDTVRDGLESATVRLYGALRALGEGITSTLLAHVSKQEAQREGPGAGKAYGSVFVMNLARSAWEIRAEPETDADTLRVALFHRKSNRSRLHPPISLRLHFGPGAITLRAADLAESPTLAARGGLVFRIRVAVATGPLTSAELAKHLNAPEDTVDRTCRRLRGKGQLTAIPDSRPIRWALPSDRANQP